MNLSEFEASPLLYKELKEKTLQLLKLAEKEGLHVGVFCGFRSFKEQDALYYKGGVTKARGGYSWHCYGLAVDIVFKTQKGNWSWDKKWKWHRLGQLGKQVGLEWGGDFKSIKDLCHFQLTHGLRISDAFRLYHNGSLKAVWSKIGELK